MDGDLTQGLFYDNFHLLMESLGLSQDTVSYGQVEGDREVIGQRWDSYPLRGQELAPMLSSTVLGITAFVSCFAIYMSTDNAH